MTPSNPFTSAVIGAAVLAFLTPVATHSQADPPPPPSLKTVRVPEPPNLTEFIRNRQLAIVLGKALFWDMQIGSDGIVACATCHFHAGADSRSVNQLNPGLKQVQSGTYAPAPDLLTAKGINAALSPADFPFRKLADPNNRNSAVVSDTNDVASSQGVFNTAFMGVTPGTPTDSTMPVPDPDGFQVGGVNVRRVEPRNTPTIINAVFNFRNFWDGRAQNVFNGVNHLGDRDPQARVYRADNPLILVETRVSIPSSSLASQAVAPPVNGTEQSASGRTFLHVAEKATFRFRPGPQLLSIRPLAKQLVAPDDSVLGPYSRWPQPGLTFASYQDLIKQAFQPRWWLSSGLIRVNADGSRTVIRLTGVPKENEYFQIQYNFSLFFGLAVQMYEATLVSDDTPFDRFMAGNASALSPLQQQGLALFLSQTRGRCINCHTGPEFTEASAAIAGARRIRRREQQLIDTGFFNIGVRPHLEDLSLGDTDGTAANQPLSEARRARLGTFFDPTLNPPLSPTDVLAVDGAFKVPGLRNVELTAPYFHNGGQRTLREVIDFYSRGGDFQPIQSRDGIINPVQTLNLTDAEKNAFVAFLVALTDERVRNRKAPFDHPQIFVPNGHEGSTMSVQSTSNGQAVDRLVEIPAVGRNGGPPLRNFLE
jgi:cytochrome c peroxidase